MKAVVAISAGLVHAVLMLLAYPPLGLWPAALVAILPLVWAVVRIARSVEASPEFETAPSRRHRLMKTVRPALLIGLGVFPFYIYQLHWLIPVTAVGYVPMAIGMALFASAFVWLVSELRVRLSGLPLTLTVPIIWTGLEAFRGEVAFSGYPWFLIAHPLIDAPLLPLPARVLGTYFVSFLVAMLAGTAADAWLQGSRHRRAALAGAGAAVVVFAGSLIAPGGRAGPEDSVMRIAIIQTNLPQDNKIAWTIEQKLIDFERFLQLTAEAAAVDPPPDLIIWPETMFPELLDPDSVAEQRRTGLVYSVDPDVHPPGHLFATAFHDALIDLQRATGVPMLVGAVGADDLRIDVDDRGRIMPRAEAWYNSVLMVRDGRVERERYDKLRLTPFGEFMPYINQWPWLERQLLALGARGMSFDLSPGAEPRTFRVQNWHGASVAFATPICFEATAPRLNNLLLRSIDGEHPRILVNVTNDGWFSTFMGGREQHLQISRWRALESGVPMVRAANTGISAWIDHRGALVRAGTDDGALAFADGILTADVQPTVGGTIYGRIGEVFAWVVLAGAGGLILVAFAGRRAGG